MSNSGKKPTADDEVEQLLRAAQDDMLLKLSINSHMARASDSAAINPDLDRRFLALKNPQKPTQVNDSTIKPPTKKDNRVDGAAADDDDLFARFAALKNSHPSHSGKENKSDESFDQQVIEEEDEEDEVEKIIKWAIDAARLDPSPPSESDDSDDSEDDSLDEDDRTVDGGKKKNKRK